MSDFESAALEALAFLRRRLGFDRNRPASTLS